MSCMFFRAHSLSEHIKKAAETEEGAGPVSLRHGRVVHAETTQDLAGKHQFDGSLVTIKFCILPDETDMLTAYRKQNLPDGVDAIRDFTLIPGIRMGGPPDFTICRIFELITQEHKTGDDSSPFAINAICLPRAPVSATTNSPIYNPRSRFFAKKIFYPEKEG